MAANSKTAEIKRRLLAGEYQTDIAQALSISRAHVSMIAKRTRGYEPKRKPTPLGEHLRKPVEN